MHNQPGLYFPRTHPDSPEPVCTARKPSDAKKILTIFRPAPIILMIKSGETCLGSAERACPEKRTDRAVRPLFPSSAAGMQVIFLKGVLYMSFKNAYLAKVYDQVLTRNPNEPEFQQAVREVLESLELVVEKNPSLVETGVIDRMVEPERMILAASSTRPSAPIRAACACTLRSTPRLSNSWALSSASRTA